MAEEKPNTPTPEVAPDPDAAKYEEMKAEFEAEENPPEPDPEIQRGEDGKFTRKEPAPEPDPEPKAPAESKEEATPSGEKELTPEELKRNYRNTQNALREARERAQESENRLASITELIQQLRAGKGEEEEKPKIPDRNEDPIGYFEAKFAQQEKLIEELKSGNQRTTEQIEQDKQQQTFWNTVIASEREIRQTTPDYDDATKHLEAGRVAELQIMYPDDSPQAESMARQYNLPSVEALRMMVLNQDRINVATQAIQTGRSPAQLYYELALKRGYAPKEADKPNGAAKKAAAEAIEAQQRGIRASRSISGGDGSKTDNPLSINDLADLYDEDPEQADKVFMQMAKRGLLG